MSACDVSMSGSTRFAAIHSAREGWRVKLADV